MNKLDNPTMEHVPTIITDLGMIDKRHYVITECLTCKVHFKTRLDSLKYKNRRCKSCSSSISSIAPILNLDQKTIRTYFKYNKDTGSFIWICKTGPKSNQVIGKEAGSLNHGYIRIKFNNTIYPITHLIWIWEHGFKPEYIDHINHNRLDNRLVNLRETTYAENNKNRSATKNSLSGVLGVTWNKRDSLWYAGINDNGKHIHLGAFKKLKDAISEREKANVRYKYHKNHGK